MGRLAVERKTAAGCTIGACDRRCQALYCMHGDAVTTKDPFLLALGERVRLLRCAPRPDAQVGRAWPSGVSERHLANLEYGVGNASILVLQQVAGALDCSLAELVGDVTTSSPEWLMLRELLRGRSDAELRRARARARASCSAPTAATRRAAGASRWSACAAPASRRSAACSPSARAAVRRAEPRDRADRRLQHPRDPRPLRHQRLPPLRAARARGDVRLHPTAVIATPGGIVSEPATFNAAARPLHDGLAAGVARRAHGARRGAGRHCGRWRRAARRWPTCAASWPAAPPSTPRPTPRFDTAAQRR